MARDLVLSGGLTGVAIGGMMIIATHYQDFNSIPATAMWPMFAVLVACAFLGGYFWN